MTETKKYERKRSRRDASTTVQTPYRLLTMEDVVALVQLTESTIRRMIARDTFPKPVIIPPDSKRPEHRWRLKDIEDWSKRQQTADDRLPAA